MPEHLVDEKLIVETLDAMPAFYITKIHTIVALYNETLDAMLDGEDWGTPFQDYQIQEELFSRQTAIPLPAVKQICAHVFGEPSQTK